MKQLFLINAIYVKSYNLRVRVCGAFLLLFLLSACNNAAFQWVTGEVSVAGFPYITHVSTSQSNQYFKDGGEIYFIVHFSESIVINEDFFQVSGTPKVSLNLYSRSNPGARKDAVYVSPYYEGLFPRGLVFKVEIDSDDNDTTPYLSINTSVQMNFVNPTFVKDRDEGLNAGYSFTGDDLSSEKIRIDTTLPSMDDLQTDATDLHNNDNLNIDLVFNENIYSNSSNSITLNNGVVLSGTIIGNILRFVYTVGNNPSESTSLLSVQSSSISNLRDAAGNYVIMPLDLSSLQTKNISVDVYIPPTVASISSTLTQRDNKVELDTIPIDVAFDKDVIVSGSPSLFLNNSVEVTGCMQSGSTQFSCVYTVGQSGAVNNEVISSLEVLSIELNGGSIVSNVGSLDADLSLDSLDLIKLSDAGPISIISNSSSSSSESSSSSSSESSSSSSSESSSSSSSSSSAVTLAAPTSFASSFSAGNPSVLTFSWNDNAVGEEGYELSCQDVNNSLDPLVKVVASNTTSTTFSNLVSGLSYNCSIFAKKAGSNSATVSITNQLFPLYLQKTYSTYSPASSFGDADWNVYIEDQDSTPNTAFIDLQNTAQIYNSESSTASYQNSIHVGERRFVNFYNISISDCRKLKSSDVRLQEGVKISQDIFNWSFDCDNLRMYSEGFKNSKGLADLINETAWKDLVVQVDTSRFTSPIGILKSNPQKWAANPIINVPNHRYGRLSLLSPTAGTIFTVVPSLPSLVWYTNGLIVDVDRASLVTLNSSHLELENKVPLVNFSTGSDLSADTASVVAVSGVNNVWIEAELDGNGLADTTLYFSDMNVSRVNNSIIQNSDNLTSPNVNMGMYLNASLGNRLSNLVIANNFRGALLTNNSNNNLFNYGAIQNSFAREGLLISNSSFNRFVNYSISNSSLSNLVLNSSSQDNVFAGLTLSNSEQNGLTLTGASTNSNKFVNTTIVNNIANGIQLAAGASSNHFHSLIIARNGTGTNRGLWVDSGTSANRFSNVAVFINKGTGIYLDSPAIFAGALLLGANFTGHPESGSPTNCTVTGSGSGLDASCNPNGASSANLVNLGNSVSDYQNLTTVFGYQQSPIYDFNSYSLSSFLNFISPQHTWGRANDPSTPSWPDISYSPATSMGQFDQGYCGLSDTCANYDWALNSLSNYIYNNSVTGQSASANSTPAEATECPTMVVSNIQAAGIDKISLGGILYLKAAVEVVGNYAAGNGNGFCEKGERCIYSPNFGSYQGEGRFKSCQSEYMGDPLNQATFYLYKDEFHFYETNGRTSSTPMETDGAESLYFRDVPY